MLAIQRLLPVLAFTAVALTSLSGYADTNSCQKKRYEGGWLKKYDFKGNTWRANSQKAGFFTSSNVSTENTTTLVDPGVTTGHVQSTVQFTSSWGECAGMDLIFAKLMREDYIKQNLPEIKKQVASGQGYHVDSLATLSGCQGVDRVHWSEQLQSHTTELYDAKTGEAFRKALDEIILHDSTLKAACDLTV